MSIVQIVGFSIIIFLIAIIAIMDKFRIKKLEEVVEDRYRLGDRIVFTEDYQGQDVLVRAGTLASITQIYPMVVSIDGFSLEIKINDVSKIRKEN